MRRKLTDTVVFVGVKSVAGVTITIVWSISVDAFVFTTSIVHRTLVHV